MGRERVGFCPAQPPSSFPTSVSSVLSVVQKANHLGRSGRRGATLAPTVAKVPGFELPLDEVRASLETLRRPLRIAILRFRNPFNVGAIIRVAHSFLVQEILLVGDEPYYERAAMGMQRYENLIKLPDEQALVTWARERKLPLIAFEREHARVDLWRAELPEACVMVFGSETSGVSEELLAEVDNIVAIPMYGINNSFPVTVAAGIAMAEWTRRYYVHSADAGSP